MLTASEMRDGLEKAASLRRLAPLSNSPVPFMGLFAFSTDLKLTGKTELERLHEIGVATGLSPFLLDWLASLVEAIGTGTNMTVAWIGKALQLKWSMTKS